MSEIRSRVATDEYRQNHDRVFGSAKRSPAGTTYRHEQFTQSFKLSPRKYAEYIDQLRRLPVREVD